jgi:hypothetical protein
MADLNKMNLRELAGGRGGAQDVQWSNFLGEINKGSARAYARGAKARTSTRKKAPFFCDWRLSSAPPNPDKIGAGNKREGINDEGPILDNDNRPASAAVDVEHQLEQKNEQLEQLQTTLASLHKQKFPGEQSRTGPSVPKKFVFAPWDEHRQALPAIRGSPPPLAGGKFAGDHSGPLITEFGSMTTSFQPKKDVVSLSKSVAYRYQSTKGLLDIKKRERGKLLIQLRPVAPTGIRPKSSAPWNNSDRHRPVGRRQIVCKKPSTAFSRTGTLDDILPPERPVKPRRKFYPWQC